MQVSDGTSKCKLFKMPQGLRGRLSLRGVTGINHMGAIYDVEWNGTTLTVKTIAHKGGGGVAATSTLVIHEGSLALSVYSSQTANIEMMMDFDGSFYADGTVTVG